jgi:hypothetical protein
MRRLDVHDARESSGHGNTVVFGFDDHPENRPRKAGIRRELAECVMHLPFVVLHIRVTDQEMGGKREVMISSDAKMKQNWLLYIHK